MITKETQIINERIESLRDLTREFLSGVFDYKHIYFYETDGKSVCMDFLIRCINDDEFPEFVVEFEKDTMLKTGSKERRRTYITELIFSLSRQVNSRILQTRFKEFESEYKF